MTGVVFRERAIRYWEDGNDGSARISPHEQEYPAGADVVTRGEQSNPGSDNPLMGIWMIFSDSSSS